MPKKLFCHLRAFEHDLMSSYNRIALIVQGIIARHITESGVIDDFTQLRFELERYSDILGPWAMVFWERLLERQQSTLAGDWKLCGILIGDQNPIVLSAVASMLSDEVGLIKTLPLEAARKAQAMALEAATVTGERAETLIQRLQGLKPGYPEYAARRLARSEIAKTQSLLVQAQAKSAGITHYIWRTMKDEAVRPEHSVLEGRVFAFDDKTDKDGKGAVAPGMTWNCRCYCEPIIPDRPGERESHNGKSTEMAQISP